MKIIGKTTEGDLMIQVSQDEWNSLQDGIRPKEDWQVKQERWQKTEVYKFFEAHRKLTGKTLYGYSYTQFAVYRNEIDGSIQSLQDIASGKIRVNGIGPVIQAKLKNLLDNHRTQDRDKRL